MQEVLFFNSVATGWNTWNNKNTLSHVLLPSAFSVTVGYPHFFVFLLIATSFLLITFYFCCIWPSDMQILPPNNTWAKVWWHATFCTLIYIYLHSSIISSYTTIIFTSDINVVFIILVVVECNNDLMSGLHAPFGNYTEISSFSPFNNLQLHIESAQTSEVYICYYFLFFFLCFRYSSLLSLFCNW